MAERPVDTRRVVASNSWVSCAFFELVSQQRHGFVYWICARNARFSIHKINATRLKRLLDSLRE